MPHTVLQNVMVTATPQYVNRDDWPRLQAGGALHAVGCWHPEHGAFEITVSATSKASAVAAAAGMLMGTGAVACHAGVSDPSGSFSSMPAASGVRVRQ
jgi:hypothetical protein